MSFRRRLVVLLAVASLSAIAGTVYPGTPYHLTDLGGANYSSQANAVNIVSGAPMIVGQVQTSSTAYSDACVWTPSGGGFAMTDIGTLLYNTYNSTLAGTGYNWYNSYCTGINSSGQIVGVWNSINSDNWIWSTPFVYSNGTLINLNFPGNNNPPPGLPNNFNPYNVLLNSNGIVGGYGQVGIDPTSHPYTLNLGTGAFTDLFVSGGGGNGIAANVFAMNNNGWMAGTGPTGPATAYVWNGSTWTDLGVPSSSYTKGSRANAIDSKGDVVGLVGTNTATKGDPMYVPYNAPSWGTMVDLGNLGGVLSGYTNGQANSINDNGQIVGFCFNGLKTPATEAAFLSGTTAGSMVPLSNLVANLNGWRLCTATAIDNMCDVVGLATDAGGNSKAFLLNAMPGDANLDGTVNISDLSVVLANYDKTGMSWSQGDFDGNGGVDISDLSKILANYDKTASAAAGGIRAVPEPGTLALLAAGLSGLLAHAWRRRK